MKKIIFYLLLSMFFVFTGCDSKNQPEKDETKTITLRLDATEYKLMLNPQMFNDIENGFDSYWKIIQEVADAEKIPISPADNPLKLKHQEISFFDTPDLGLRKSGFLLRRKVKYKNGQKKPGIELTFKFRRIKPQEVLAIDLKFAEGFIPKSKKIELESDIVYFSAENGKEKTTFSVSNTIKIDHQPDMTIGKLEAICPALGKLEIPSETMLKKVTGSSAEAWKISPGKIDFGDGLIAELDMAIWILETDAGQIKIPEFSFDHAYNEDRAWDETAMLRCTSFINKLHEAHPEWVVPGISKTTALFEQN